MPTTLLANSYGFPIRELTNRHEYSASCRFAQLGNIACESILPNSIALLYILASSLSDSAKFRPPVIVFCAPAAMKIARPACTIARPCDTYSRLHFWRGFLSPHNIGGVTMDRQGFLVAILKELR